MGKRRKTTRTAGTSDVAAEFDVGRNAVITWARDKDCPHDGGEGKPYRFDIAEVAAWMRDNNLTGKPGRPQSAQSATREEADLRKTNAMADNWEIRNAKELRDLLPAAEVKRAWSAVAQEVRSKVLGTAASVGPSLVGMAAQEIITELERALSEAMQSLDPDDEPTTARNAA